MPTEEQLAAVVHDALQGLLVEMEGVLQDNCGSGGNLNSSGPRTAEGLQCNSIAGSCLLSFCIRLLLLR